MNTAMDGRAVDDVIQRLLEVRTSGYRREVRLLDAEICQLCAASKKIFLEQPNLLQLGSPMTIIGDIHGQYYDLLRLLEHNGFPPTVNYLFLGNYVDHGKQSIETICLLLAYKIKYPENFFLLRGNHECESVNRIYGFYDECKRRFNVRLWKVFIDCFNCLPVAACIEEKIFCVHGGLSPDLKNLQQIDNIARPTDVPDWGLLCDLLWSDPSTDVQGWGPNDREVSYTFGPNKVSEFLQKHDLDLICRGHQIVEDGYEFFADRQLVTIFSAPNFCGEYDNAGALMSVDESLWCSFKILKPVSSTVTTGLGTPIAIPGVKNNKETMIENYATSSGNNDHEERRGEIYRTASQHKSSDPSEGTSKVEEAGDSLEIEQEGRESREGHLDKIMLETQSKQDIEEFIQEETKGEICGTSSQHKNSNPSKITSSLKVFSYLDIEGATNGLSELSKIGQGGYGSVHKGYLDNTEVAIKVLDVKSHQGLEEFNQELEVLGQMRHPNIVNLIGACFKLRALIYEFLPNGSVEDCLKKSPRLLTWQMRTRIAHEICSALVFIHSSKPLPLVHGDLKPHNILLDAHFKSKLADFGLCRFLPEGTSSAAFLDTRPKGTLEYIDPVFLRTGILTPFCDVYSFGVTILRLLTGMKPLGLATQVLAAYKEKLVMTMVDPTAGNWPTDVAEFLAYYGLQCCKRKKGSQLMKEILEDLEIILDAIDN